VNTPHKRSGMARVFIGYHSFTCTPRVHPLTQWTTPAFGFFAEDDLALCGWLVTYRNKCPAPGTEPSAH